MVGLAVPYDTPVNGILFWLALDLSHNLYAIVGKIYSHGLGLGIDELFIGLDSANPFWYLLSAPSVLGILFQ